MTIYERRTADAVNYYDESGRELRTVEALKLKAAGAKIIRVKNILRDLNGSPVIIK